jgi:MFS family permease
MLKRLIKRDIHALYLNNLFRGIAFSLFGIFIPIFFLTLGFTLRQVFIYSLVESIATFLFFFIGGVLARKIGYKWLMIISSIFVTAFVILLRMLPLDGTSLYLIALICGVQNGFYYLPLHAFFTKFSEKESKGAQVSIFSIFGQASGLFGPLIGALIALSKGFNYLFVVVLIFMLISFVPIISLNNFNPKHELNLKRFREFCRRQKGFFSANIMSNIKDEIEGIIWPIFVFLTLQDLISIGWVGFLVSAGTILFTFFIGRHFDKMNRYFFMRLGGILYAALWIARIFVDNSSFIYISSILAGFFGLMIAVPFSAIFYHKIEEDKNSDSFIIFTEIPVLIGRMIIWGSAVLLANNFKIFFILAGISSLFLSFVKLKTREN